MELLYFLEDIRTPFLDTVMSLITRFGEETLFMVIAITLFWCVDKYEGYFLLILGFFGTVTNVFLKIVFRVPRPWVTDSEFTIVESAREGASGYSFPSGHTQVSVGTYGGLAAWNKNRVLRAVCIALCVLIPVSRLYLGVHTPLDVGVSAVIAVLMIFVLRPIVRSAKEKPSRLAALCAVMISLSAAGAAYTCLCSFPADTDAANLVSAQENFFKLLGATLGLAAVLLIDRRRSFDTKAPIAGQVLKCLLGLAFTLIIKEGLKPVADGLFGASAARHLPRYFLTVVFAGGIWPLSFPYFAKIGARKK